MTWRPSAIALRRQAGGERHTGIAANRWAERRNNKVTTRKEGVPLSKREEIDAGRRDFFRKAGLGAGAAAAVAVTASGAGAVEATTSPKKGSGYAETDHVRKYYELARF